MIKKRSEFDNQFAWAEYLGNYAAYRFEEECAQRNITSLCPKVPLRWDFIAEIKNHFKKIQVKAVSIEKTRKMHRVPISSENRITGERIRYKKEEIDYFAYYLSEYDTMYLIPVAVMIKADADKIYVYDTDFYKPSNSTTAIDITKYKYW